MSVNGRKRWDARKLAVAITLIAAAGGTWWLVRLPSVPAPTTNAKKSHDPDYVVENFRSTVMDSQGRPQYQLSGERLVHFADDGSSEIDQPYLIQYQLGQASTHARALRGYLPADTSYVKLTDNVRVAHGRDPFSAGGEIETQTLMFRLDKTK